MCTCTGESGWLSMVVHDFGMQTALKAHSKDIKNAHDVLAVLAHWRLLRFGFICLCEGPNGTCLPSEVMPLGLGWDGTLKGYYLKYENQGKHYLMSLTLKESGTAEVGLLSDSRVTKVAVDVAQVVDNESLLPIMANVDEISERLDSDLIEPLGFRRIDDNWLNQWVSSPQETVGHKKYNDRK